MIMPLHSYLADNFRGVKAVNESSSTSFRIVFVLYAASIFVITAWLCYRNRFRDQPNFYLIRQSDKFLRKWITFCKNYETVPRIFSQIRIVSQSSFASQFERPDAFNGFPINNLSNLITGNYLINSVPRAAGALLYFDTLFHSRTIHLFLLRSSNICIEYDPFPFISPHSK